MNIAMFAWEALEGLSVGGGAVYASRLASALSSAGHRVRLFTRLGPGQAMDEVVNGIAVRRCPWDRRRTFIEEIDALTHAFVHYFADAAKTDGPYDVVHCHEWFTVAAGLRAVELVPARLAVGFHSTEWGRTGQWPDTGDSARIASLEGQGIARADTVIAASHWARRTIHEQFHPPDWKCEVIYHGTDLFPLNGDGGDVRRFREAAGVSPSAPCALFAGRFSLPGGGDIAARAARLVAERFPDARFLFVGAGPLEREMRETAGPSAIFLPPQGRVVPAEYYHAADVVMAPFRRDHNGRAVMPAWSAAKPIVVLRSGVPAEFVLDRTNGWVVPEEAEAVAAAVMEAFADPGRAAWMGRNGRVAVETAFTWEESAGRLVAAYRRRDRLSPPVAENPFMEERITHVVP